MSRFAILLSIAAACFAQPKDPCYAFILRGDIVAVCQGKTAQITHRGDIEHFAVSEEAAALAYIAGSSGTAAIVDLKTAATRNVDNADGVVSSCGGILPIPLAATGSTHDLATGAELAFAPYSRFRCSSDRRKVIGITRHELFEGQPPAGRLATAGDVHDLYFNISPDGSKSAWFNDVRPLCVYAAPGPPQCVEHETMSDPVSVANTGEVLAAAGTGKGCVYKTSANFTPVKTAGGGDDECLGVGYWKPGMPAIVFLQELGRNPQWIRPETAALLTAWSRQSKSR